MTTQSLMARRKRNTCTVAVVTFFFAVFYFYTSAVKEEVAASVNTDNGSLQKQEPTKSININEGSSDETSKTVSVSQPESEPKKEVSKDQLLKCTNKDETRWSNKPFATSKVQSLVNCDLSDAGCKYYYPANFFDKECGLGKEFAHHIDDAQAKQANGTLWNNMPAVGFPTLTLNDVCINPETKERIPDLTKRISSASMVLTDIGEHNTGTELHCMKERLSFLHVHKAGGSSLHAAFNFISNHPGAKLVRHKFFTPNSRPGIPEISTYSEKMRNQTLDSLAEATKYPDEEFSTDQHVIFAAVRDPTERFISSIGQALGAVGSSGNRIGPILKKECIKATSKETLKCLAHYVQDNGYWIELHFTPQVVDISFTTMYQDVPISIFPFKELTTILTYFGRGGVRARDGSSQNYRSDPVLTNMTVADYDEESLRVVCQIYEMDVRMQRSLGIEVPRCDPFIPHIYEF